MKQNILEKLKVFQDFKFFEDGHYYEYKGKRVGISVTRLIEEYTNEFKQQEMAEMVANKNGLTTQEVLDEWKYKADFACAKGSTCHEFAQSLWSCNVYEPLRFDESQKYKDAVAWLKVLGTSIDSPIFKADNKRLYILLLYMIE